MLEQNRSVGGVDQDAAVTAAAACGSKSSTLTHHFLRLAGGWREAPAADRSGAGLPTPAEGTELRLLRRGCDA